MRLLFVLVIVIHGLIHLMGFAKAFGLAELPQLTLPISRPAGLLWLVAALLLLAAAAAWLLRPQWFVALAVTAVVVSQLVIVLSWSNARYGTVGNLVVIGGIAASLMGTPRS